MKQSTRLHRQEILRRKKMRQRLAAGAAIAALLLFLFLAGYALRPQPEVRVDAGDRALVAQGQQVYATNCAACHGVNLEGQPDWRIRDETGVIKAPPHDETGHTWHHSDAYLIDSIRRGGARLPADAGISTMPAYDDVLSDAEISAVLAFIKNDWPAEILAAQSQR